MADGQFDVWASREWRNCSWILVAWPSRNNKALICDRKSASCVPMEYVGADAGTLVGVDWGFDMMTGPRLYLGKTHNTFLSHSVAVEDEGKSKGGGGTREKQREKAETTY